MRLPPGSGEIQLHIAWIQAKFKQKQPSWCKNILKEHIRTILELTLGDQVHYSYLGSLNHRLTC